MRYEQAVKDLRKRYHQALRDADLDRVQELMDEASMMYIKWDDVTAPRNRYLLRGNLAIWAIAFWKPEHMTDPNVTQKTRRIYEVIARRQTMLNESRLPTGGYPQVVSNIAGAVLDSINARLSRKDA